MPIVGFLVPGTSESYGRYVEAFLVELKERGYVPGRDVVLELRLADEMLDRLTALAGDLASRKVDVIVTASIPATKAARHATAIIPIIQASGGDLILSGLADGLARPGGNVTGLYNMTEDLAPKLLQHLMDVAHEPRRLGVLVNPNNEVTERSFSQIQEGARMLGIEYLIYRAPNRFALDETFAKLSHKGLGGLIILSDPMFLSSSRYIVTLAANARVPTIYPFRAFAADGGLMSYGIDLRANFRRAAVYLDKILKDAEPAELPIEQPVKFEMVINLKTAKALGITIPPSIMVRADEVIE
jgi:putative ABC transport system substrate-binding protein